MSRVIDWGWFKLHESDCLEAMRAMPDNSVDSIVTDPPYGLTTGKKGGTGVASVNLESPYGRARIGTGNGAGGFMGHKWDSDVPSVEIWTECLRVLKPGGYLLAFAGTRTQHRMATRIEDAGFEIRDLIAWVYGSGFPKSHNGEWGGTALKPALEPITMARKPLVSTVEENWLAYGTGALNIDACRVPTTDKLGGGDQSAATKQKVEGWGRPWMQDEAAKAAHADRVNSNVAKAEALGRWPANLIHDGSDEVLNAFPAAPGQQGPISATAPSEKTSNVYGRMRRDGEASAGSENAGAVGFKMKPGMRRLDEGSAARFFYCAKASKADRGEGNTHPTVKPTELMRYLCRLVTPAGGLVLDPFMGSGSTGKAAVSDGFKFVGCEMSHDYMQIAERRVREAFLSTLGLAA